MFTFEQIIKANICVEGIFGPIGSSPKALSWRASRRVRSMATGVIVKAVDVKNGWSSETKMPR